MKKPKNEEKKLKQMLEDEKLENISGAGEAEQKKIDEMIGQLKKRMEEHKHSIKMPVIPMCAYAYPGMLNPRPGTGGFKIKPRQEDPEPENPLLPPEPENN